MWDELRWCHWRHHPMNFLFIVLSVEFIFHEQHAPARIWVYIRKISNTTYHIYVNTRYSPIA